MFEHLEPAQYLDRVNQIILEKSVLVSAIDEVYPELKLGERLNKAQYAMSPTLPLPPPRAAVWPGVREPAHMMPQWASDPLPIPGDVFMAEIAQVIERYGPLPDPWKAQIMSEIASVLGKYSYAMLNPQPLPPRMAAWPGVREPAHLMAPSQWASGHGPNPGAMERSLRSGKQALPAGRDAATAEMRPHGQVRLCTGPRRLEMMDLQWASDPSPSLRQMHSPGVRDPAHQMAGMQPEMPQQMLSEMAAVMRRYGFQI